MRRSRLAVLVVVSLGTALVARARMEARARELGRSFGGALTSLSSPDAARGTSAEDPDVVSSAGAPWSGVLAEDAEESSLGTNGKSKSKGRRGHERPKNGILVRASTVLRLAQRGIVPEGRPVDATASRPAGVELHGVSALGTGVEDGDVLTEVAGAKVHTEGQVVGAVVGLRAAHAPSVSAIFYRGSVPFALTVEMPYPPGAP